MALIITDKGRLLQEQRQDNYHAKMAYEAWHDEFIKSNPDQRNDENLLKQADCHLANEVDDAYDMEDIVMVSSPMHINISAQLRLSGKLKVRLYLSPFNTKATS